MATAATLSQEAETGPVPETPSAPLSAHHPPHHPPQHPKTGERRRARRPLRLDRLPLALLDRIRAERAQQRTWDEIECDSPHWEEWEQATPEVLAAFPGRRLPHTNVQRWHDLRVEQVQRERDAQSVAAQAFADRLAARGIAPGAAIRNAFSDSVFRLAIAGADEKLIRDELCRLAHVTAALERGEIARQRLELDRRKLELAAQQAEVTRLLAMNDMSESTLNLFLDRMEISPAFASYYEARIALSCARDAARPPEDPYDDAEDGDLDPGDELESDHNESAADEPDEDEPDNNESDDEEHDGEEDDGEEDDDEEEPEDDDGPKAGDPPPSPAFPRLREESGEAAPRAPRFDHGSNPVAAVGEDRTATEPPAGENPLQPADPPPSPAFPRLREEGMPEPGLPGLTDGGSGSAPPAAPPGEESPPSPAGS